MADKYGGKATLGFGMLLSSLGTILTPFVARSYGPTPLVVLRLIIGLAQVWFFLNRIIVYIFFYKYILLW